MECRVQIAKEMFSGKASSAQAFYQWKRAWASLLTGESLFLASVDPSYLTVLINFESGPGFAK
jgi:hypothetical protein